MAWGIRVEGAAPLAAVLLGMYLLFLTWLVGLVGSRGQQIRRQNEELLRIDRTVRALSEANLDFQELATRVQRETEEQERRRITREIHDIVGYTLTNIQMMMEAATDLVRRDAAGLEDLLVKSRDQAQRGLMETRRAMRNLRDRLRVKTSGLGRVDGGGADLREGHKGAGEAELRQRSGELWPAHGRRRLPDGPGIPHQRAAPRQRDGNLGQFLGRGAARCGSALRTMARGPKEIVPGIGLAGMAERIAHVGGTMKAESTPFGFLVFSEIPLRRRGM